MTLKDLLEMTTSVSAGDNLIPINVLRKAIRRPLNKKDLYTLINFKKEKK